MATGDVMGQGSHSCRSSADRRDDRGRRVAEQERPSLSALIYPSSATYSQSKVDLALEHMQEGDRERSSPACGANTAWPAEPIA
jgi:hypothetical protein